jgi:hypothetical protein
VGVDLERDRAAVRPGYHLVLEVDRDHSVGAAFRVVHQQVDVLLRQHDRQDAVLEAIVVEDVRKRGRDHAADPEVHERPRRVLAA